MQRERTKEELWLKATTYCSKGEHCRQEVREKLWQWGCRNDNWREQILGILIDEGYIDEQRYCKAYVHDKVEYQSWGRIKIRMMLLAKGLKERDIDAALEQVDISSYAKALQKALDKYPNDRERQIRLALQRGFDYAEISEIIKNK